MSVTVVTVLFFALVLGLLLVPLIPAVREIRSRFDAEALPIAADGRVSPSYFAERFRLVLGNRLSGPLDEVRASGQVLRGRIDDGEAFVVLPTGRTHVPDDDDSTASMILAVGDLDVEPGRSLDREIFAEGDIRAGDGVVLRATLADGDVTLGEGTTSLRWIHADGTVRVGPSCRLHGRVSARRRVRIEGGVRFERLHAPRVEFGEPLDPDPPSPDQLRALSADDLDGRTEVAAGRTLVHGDVTLPPDTRWTGDLVVRGTLRAGPGTRIEGSVKARGVHLESATVVTGSAVSTKGASIGPRVRIDGLLITEGHVRLGHGSVIGREPESATLRAETLDVEAGCVVHGTVWVGEDGGWTES
jgi:predicted acyltransferase (DUF342 family)